MAALRLSTAAAAIIYAVGSWGMVGAFSMVEATRIRRYLRDHHHIEWTKVTSVPGLGPGHYNSAALLRFVFSKQAPADPTLEEMRRSGRWAASLVPVAFFAILPVTIIVAF